MSYYAFFKGWLLQTNLWLAQQPHPLPLSYYWDLAGGLLFPFDDKLIPAV